MKKLLTSLLILVSLVLTACPKVPKTVREFREKSAQLSTYGEEIITAIGDAKVAGEITAEQLSAINPVTGVFVKGVGTYRTLLAQAEVFVSEGKSVPQDLLSQIARSLQVDVEDTFFAVTSFFVTLSPQANERLKGVFTALRTLVTSLKILFAEAKAVNDRLDLAGRSGGISYGLA